MFQLTAARRRLGHSGAKLTHLIKVSTHSRPKAAGQYGCARDALDWRFNSQPPEGGWLEPKARAVYILVSTHSRPKAAGRPIQMS